MYTYVNSSQYTLEISHSFIYQLYLNKAEKKKMNREKRDERIVRAAAPKHRASSIINQE